MEGVLGHLQAVLGEDHLAAALRHAVGERLDRLIAVLALMHVADIDGVDAARVAGHQVGVHFRVVLAAVADQDERQLLVERQHALDQHRLVVLGADRQRPLQGHAPFAQEQHRPVGNVVEAEELHQHVVNAPGAPRHVQHGAAALAAFAVEQRPVERGHARKGGAVAGLGDKQLVHHGQLAGDAGVDHRVVDVADHRQVHLTGWNIDLGGGGHAAFAGRRVALIRRGQQLQPRLLPESAVGQRLLDRQLHAEITVPVGGDAGARVAHGDRHPGVADAPAGGAAGDVHQVVERALAQLEPQARLPEHAPHQEHCFPGAVAPVGLNHLAATAADAPRRARQKTQHFAQAAIHGPRRRQDHDPVLIRRSAVRR